MKLPRYTSKDYEVLLWVVLPMTVVLNTLIFGKLYYSSWPVFLLATAITCLACAIDFILCGFVAVACKTRFPNEKQLAKRLTIMIVMFLTITGLFLFSLFRGYETIGFYGYTFNEIGFVWCYIALGIFNIFLTFLHEGISRYEEWKANIREMEQVRMCYRQSQLHGLKSQINPHFLFNSLNSLSSLITEDGEAAEKFLDEMSKIYRYMLHDEEDQLVTLKTELSFIESYFYLLNARYSQALKLTVEIPEKEKHKWIPPLSMQVIIENAIVQNAFSKSSPLEISIYIEDEDLVVRNTIQRKIGNELMDIESGLDNLIEKYRLLNQSQIRIMEDPSQRIIYMPLITRKEKMAL